MKKITVAEVEFVAFEMAKALLSFNEPIPNFSTRFPHVLESCILSPFQSFAGKPVYKGLIRKASVLFYLMVKNHPFQNGNKRVAVMTLLVFLYKNKKWLRVDTKAFYNFSVWVAESPSELKEEVINAIAKFIKKHLEVGA